MLLLVVEKGKTHLGNVRAFAAVFVVEGVKSVGKRVKVEDMRRGGKVEKA